MPSAQTEYPNSNLLGDLRVSYPEELLLATWLLHCLLEFRHFWGPDTQVTLSHPDGPLGTLKLPSSALLTGKLFKNVLTIQ